MDNRSIDASGNINLLLDKDLNINKSCFNSIPKRYVLAIFAFFGFFFAYMLRANLSVAIVQMSRIKEISNKNNNSIMVEQTVNMP